MRKVLINFLIAIMLFSTSLQAQNPFKSLGVPDEEVKFLTLSQGRYAEFHKDKDYEIIGSVIIDMKNKKIAGFVDRDTLFENANYELETTTRFLTMDPCSEMYVEVTPYNYVGNNPIKLNDPTGMIWEDPNEAKELQNAAQNRINQYEKSNDRLDKRIDKAAEKGNNNKVARLTGKKSENNAAIGELQNSITQIDEMGKNQNFTFEFKKVNGEGEHHIAKGSNGNIVIEYSSKSIQLHETRHAYQYMEGGAFQFNSKGILAPTNISFWADAEKSAYRVQYAYNRSNMPDSDYNLRTIHSINYQWIGGIKGTSARPYPYKMIGNHDNILKTQYMLIRQANRIKFLNSL